MLDIAGDTWVGWQDTVADFAPDVAVCLVGCLTDARPMAVARVAACLQALQPDQRPKRFINVLPSDGAVSNPKVLARLAQAEAAASALGSACQVVNVRMGRVLACADVDALEAQQLAGYFQSPNNSGGFASNDENVPWVSAAPFFSSFLILIFECSALVDSD